MKLMFPSHLILPTVAALALAEPAAAEFLPGEILVPNYYDGVMRRYSSTGTLLQTYSSPGQETGWIGSALTPVGDYATTFRFGLGNPGFKLFDDSGTELVSFSPVGVSVSFNDVSVFADGTLALGLRGSISGIRRYSQSGTLLGTTLLPGWLNTVGSTVGADNILYIADPDNPRLGRVDQAGNFLGTIALPFNPGEVVMSPLDGTLWVTNRATQTIHNLTTAGVEIGTGFASGHGGSGSLSGLGITPDGQSLYATTTTSNVMRHLDLTGASLGDIILPGTSNGHYYFTVVPVPEPGSAGLLALGALALLAGRRRG